MEHLDTIGKSVGELLCEAYVEGFREAENWRAENWNEVPTDEEIRASFHEWITA